MRLAWLVLAFSLVAAPPVQAQPPAPIAERNLAGQQVLDPAVFPGLANAISLDLRGMDVVEVLKFLATQGQFNIVTSAEVQGRVTLVLQDVTVRDALDIVLVSNGLAVERRGKILYVMSAPLYEQLYGLRYSDPRESLTIKLRYANPGQVGALLSNIKSPVGRIVIDEPTATLALLDVPAVLAQMKTLIDSVDIPTIERRLPTVTKSIPLQYAKVEEVQPQVESALTRDVGVLRVDKRSNILIVTDMPARMPQIEALVAAFDTSSRQVYIESTILSVTLNDEFHTGIAWTVASESKHFPDMTITNSLPISSDAGNAISLAIGSLRENDITATIRALQTFGDTKVLSSPHIAAMNNEEAKILVGRRVPYAVTSVSQAQSTATTAESIEFIDVGVKLFVTPIINSTGYVTLKIRPEVSSVVDQYLTSNGNEIPVVETTEAETRVVVKDGATIIIGGLMKDTVALSTQKVPMLGNVPLLGALFKNRSDTIQKEELVILMTPHIVTPDNPYQPAPNTAQVDWPSAATRKR